MSTPCLHPGNLTRDSLLLCVSDHSSSKVPPMTHPCERLMLSHAPAAPSRLVDRAFAL